MTSKKPSVKRVPKEDLAAARAELKQFRHDVSILKKKGLLNKKYDARSVVPTKYLKAQVKAFESALKGEAQPVKVSKAKAAYYAAKGFAIKNRRVIVPVQPNERVYSTHGDFRTKITSAGGSIIKINLGLNERDLNKWVRDLRNNRFKIGNDEALSFQLFGNNSHRVYRNLPGRSAQQQMAEQLENYPSFQDTEESRDASKMSEYIREIVLFKIKRTPGMDTEDPNAFKKPPKGFKEYRGAEEDMRRFKERKAESYQRRLGRMSDKQYEHFRAEKSREEKERRASLTPAQREAYKAKSRERAAKSRTNRKKG